MLKLFNYLLLLFCISFDSIADDLTPPILEGFEITTKNVDASESSQQVTVLLTITDESSVQPPNVVAKSVLNDSATGFGVVRLVSGDNTNGTWEAKLTVPKGATAGEWSVTLFPLTDIAGNSTSFGPGVQFDNSFFVRSNSSDLDVPILVDFEITTKNIDVTKSSQYVTVLFTVTDESGIEPPNLIAKSVLNGSTTGFGVVRLVSGDNTNGTWEATLTVPKGATSGEWRVSLFPLTDIAGNSTSFGSGVQFDNSFFVGSNSSDLDVPILVDFEITTKNIDVTESSQDVTVLFTVTDESGIEPPNLIAKSVLNDSATGFGVVRLISGSVTNGTWEAILTVPKGAAAGEWGVSLFPLIDIAGNSTSFGPGNQFSNTFTVTKSNVALTLLEFSDTNGDQVADFIGYSIMLLSIDITFFNGIDYSVINHFIINHALQTSNIIILDDRDADGINEVGVFGFDASANRYQLQAHSGLTGVKQDVWSWPATLGEVKFQALTDLTGDRVQEYAISGVHLVNGTQQLVVKDGVSKSTYQTFKWPNLWDKPQFVTMSDVTFDGVPEVALYGRHSRLDKGQLFVYDGLNANSKVDVYNWNNLWSDIQLLEMDDVDGDGTIDWGQFGQRKDDGRYQWVVKKGSDKRGVIRTFTWPNDLVDVTPMLVADRTGDGIREVAVLGTSPDSGKVFLRINDGRLANSRIANISWPASWEDIQVMELGDLNNDGFSEFGLLGYTKTNRTVQLIVKDGQTAAEYGRFTLSGSWEGVSIEHYDIDSDGSDDVVISGINQGNRTAVLTSLKGTDLSLLNSQTLN
jgi:protein involved in ribonucleotide reduction